MGGVVPKIRVDDWVDKDQRVEFVRRKKLTREFADEFGAKGKKKASDKNGVHSPVLLSQ